MSEGREKVLVDFMPTCYEYASPEQAYVIIHFGVKLTEQMGSVTPLLKEPSPFMVIGRLV